MTVTPVVLGVDFGGTKIAVGACDLEGRRLASNTLPAAGGQGADVTLRRGIEAARELLRDLPGAALSAVGVATFGIPAADHVGLAPTIDGWERLALEDELSAAFAGVPVSVMTDVKAAALAEARWGSLQGCDPGIYLNLGTGLAAAIVVGGTVVRGRHGAAGEIAYNLRTLDDVGRPVDRRELLEDHVSGRALAALGATLPGRPADAIEVFQRADSGDFAAVAVVDRALTELCFHVVNLATAIDAQRVTVGGGLVGSWSWLQPRLREALDAGVPFPPDLMVAHFPYDAPLVGALAVGVETLMGSADGQISSLRNWKPSVRPPEERTAP
ncbi:MAG TPA: ROK family protein [Mycobacteriales bacterium]|nr:ROK family protein [Mycobacteriales bacterium]